MSISHTKTQLPQPVFQPQFTACITPPALADTMSTSNNGERSDLQAGG
jgi:hypothetical protein